jgi:hypothetical protein
MSCNAIQWNGKEYNGMARNGMQWSLMELNAVEWNGMQGNRMQCNAMYVCAYVRMRYVDHIHAYAGLYTYIYVDMMCKYKHVVCICIYIRVREGEIANLSKVSICTFCCWNGIFVEFFSIQFWSCKIHICRYRNPNTCLLISQFSLVNIQNDVGHTHVLSECYNLCWFSQNPPWWWTNKNVTDALGCFGSFESHTQLHQHVLVGII